MEKFCSECKKLKEISNFGIDNSKKCGYRGQCKICRAEKIKETTKRYQFNNKEKLQKQRKEYNLKNKERNKQKYLNNIDKIKKYNLNRKKYMQEYLKRWRFNNKEKTKAYRKNRTLSLNEKIIKLIRRRLLISINLAGVKKCEPTTKLIGCSIDFLKEYIESKFTKGMTWENRGNNGWHIDHIIPCSLFDLSKPEQQKLCFHYTNLQPLWATTEIAIKYGEDKNYIGNIEKSNKIKCEF